MRFLKVKAVGCLNSFRQPDFHTYHKTLPLPPKTTVAGLIGSALGIGPRIINDDWLKTKRFEMGVVGKASGKASDLWQIRKYESKQIAAYYKGKEDKPYKTAVIVRELLYKSEFILYLTFKNENDFDLVHRKLESPCWALSLGREDELIYIKNISRVDLDEVAEAVFQNTVLPFDINNKPYKILLNNTTGRNLLSDAPKTVKLPITFSHKVDSEVREADDFQLFTYISDLAIQPSDVKAYTDKQEQVSFQIF